MDTNERALDDNQERRSQVETLPEQAVDDGGGHLVLDVPGADPDDADDLPPAEQSDGSEVTVVREDDASLPGRSLEDVLVGSALSPLFLDVEYIEPTGPQVGHHAWMDVLVREPQRPGELHALASPSGMTRSCFRESAA